MPPSPPQLSQTKPLPSTPTTKQPILEIQKGYDDVLITIPAHYPPGTDPYHRISSPSFPTPVIVASGSPPLSVAITAATLKTQLKRDESSDQTSSSSNGRNYWLSYSREWLSNVRNKARRFLSSPLFITLSVFVTILALYCDLIRVAATPAAADPYFAAIVITCIAFLSIELLASCLFLPEYFLSFYFFIDLLAAVTLLLDIPILFELITTYSESSSSQHGQHNNVLTTIGTASHVGAKSARVAQSIRLLRLLRLYRLHVPAKSQDNEASPGKMAHESSLLQQHGNIHNDSSSTTVHESTPSPTSNNSSNQSTKVGEVLTELTIKKMVLTVLILVIAMPFFDVSIGYYGRRSTFDAKGLALIHSSAAMADHSHTTIANTQAAFQTVVDLYIEGTMYKLGLQQASHLLQLSIRNQSLFQADNIKPLRKSEIVAATVRSPGCEPTTVSAIQASTSSCAFCSTVFTPKNSENILYDDQYASSMQIYNTTINIHIDDDQYCWESSVLFDTRWVAQMQAILDIARITLVILVLLVSTLSIVKDADTLLIQPLQRMVKKVKDVSENQGQSLVRQLSFGALLRTNSSISTAAAATFAHNKTNEVTHQSPQQQDLGLDLQKSNDSSDSGKKKSFELTKKSMLERQSSLARQPSFSTDTTMMQPLNQKFSLERSASFPVRKSSGAALNNNNSKSRLETGLLEHSITKMCSLLSLGLGEAGAGVVADNIRRSGAEVTAISPGRKVNAIFGFCDIRQFSNITEVLQEDVLEFVNCIARVVHAVAAQHGGQANKNIGDAFLLVWKLCNEQEGGGGGGGGGGENQYIADAAFNGFVAMKEAIETDALLQEFCESRQLFDKIPGFEVQLGFGLHVGWAIEGAIGSEFKIDASYLSPHVNTASRLESATKQYGVSILLSGELFDLLSEDTQMKLRLIDSVVLKGCAHPIQLYTACMREEIKGGDEGKYTTTSPLSSSTTNKPTNRTFSQAVEEYQKGDWTTAGDILKDIVENNSSDSNDGPSCSLYNYIKSKEYKAPPDWAGYRKLYDK
jgi:class 3 adenylate cyclase